MLGAITDCLSRNHRSYSMSTRGANVLATQDGATLLIAGPLYAELEKEWLATGDARFTFAKTVRCGRYVTEEYDYWQRWFTIVTGKARAIWVLCHGNYKDDFESEAYLSDWTKQFPCST
mgnify:CR=1 FL=1